MKERSTSDNWGRLKWHDMHMYPPILIKIRLFFFLDNFFSLLKKAELGCKMTTALIQLQRKKKKSSKIHIFVLLSQQNDHSKKMLGQNNPQKCKDLFFVKLWLFCFVLQLKLFHQFLCTAPTKKQQHSSRKRVWKLQLPLANCNFHFHNLIQ